MKKISRLFNVYPLNKCSIDAYQNYLQTHKSKQAALQTTFSLCDILSQPGFSLATAPLLAHLSSLAYEWEQQAEELNSCELFLVQELHAQHIQYFSFKNAEAYGFVFQGVAFLVFCGTNDLSKDWVDNLMAVRQDYVSDGNQISDVHLGFMLHFERLRPQLLDWVDQVQNDADHFVCTGHSLGGSLAKMKKKFSMLQPLVHLRWAVPSLSNSICGQIEPGEWSTKVTRFQDRHLNTSGLNMWELGFLRAHVSTCLQEMQSP